MAGDTMVTTEVDETSSPEEIVAWALRRFADRELVLSTSFGMEGCALIDMVARHDLPVRVIWLDTMFLFPETYAIRTSGSKTAARRSRQRLRPSGSVPSSGGATPTAAARSGKWSR
jgi:3'-phosphoadenosine 5'-phosphosulfate sulfotransferase (PAPS reductase)/FAD synthetase